MSEKSAHGYRRFAAITRATLAAVSRLGAQSEPDAGRMRELGAPQVVVTGSVKFELTVPDGLETQARALRAGIGQRPVWVAGSTRDGEESLVLAAFARLRERFPDLLLILVPRHPERFEAVTRLCRQQGYVVQRRSEAGSRMAPDTAIFVGDTMGELLLFYSAADVAFVGGSLLPLGGQNPLEACVVGTPVVFGPHMFNFSEISRLLLERGAGRQVPDSAALARVVGDYLADSALRERAGAAGRQLVADNRGALDRTLALVQSVLPP